MLRGVKLKCLAGFTDNTKRSRALNSEENSPDRVLDNASAWAFLMLLLTCLVVRFVFAVVCSCLLDSFNNLFRQLNHTVQFFISVTFPY